MNKKLGIKLFFWYFCHFKVPMLGYLKPKLIKLDEEESVIRVPLTGRSRNHLNSMYFGALAAGADLAGGLQGFYQADRAQCKISLVFKSFQAQFLRRPESHVYFVCTEGKTINGMIHETQQSKERVNKPIRIDAYTDYPGQTNKVAEFILELSVKAN
jgi:acyl-coenzyme A thioesterase PaaI-like protein